MKRKGIGYIIEAMAALMVLFIFVLGNAPGEPATDWSGFQQEVMAQDLTLVLEKTGDIDDFIRNGETGTLVTAAETLTQGRLSASGTIENVPISTQVVGFHTIEENRTNVTFDSVQELNDQCYQDDSLEEIEPEDGEVMRSENSRDDTYLYIADTDPDISGGNNNIDYDSVWVDNGTRCQFSSAEGPYYLGQFFYWGNSTGEDHFDINRVYNGSNELELFLANQVIDLRPALESRMNGIDTGVVVDTMAAERNNLGSYDILVFRERESLDVLNSEKERLQGFLSDGSMLLMMDLRKKDFLLGSDALYSTGFEGNDPRWSCYSSNKDMSTCTTDATDYAEEGSESLKASMSEGLCGYGGASIEIDQTHDRITLDTKIETENWGSAHIIVENSTGVYEIKSWYGGGSQISQDWTSHTIDISNAGDDFKIIIGNHDDSEFCDNSDHGWTIWADNLELEPSDEKTNFIVQTGLKWVNLGYQEKPANPPQGSFTEEKASEEIETYFDGMTGDINQIDLRPSGNVTSSNSRYFKYSEPFLSTATGSYDTSEWNASDWNMQPVDPSTLDGYPDSACVEPGTTSDNLTEGSFDFHDYQDDEFKEYDVINTELGETDSDCRNGDVRALNIDRDRDDNFGDPDEGPFLAGQQVVIENKTFKVSFPDAEAREEGDVAEFVYTGESDIEIINYRASFKGFNGKRLARMGYKESYNTEERKMIASVVYWLSEKNVQFGRQQSSEMSTEAVGGVKENTFIPYKIMLRWR